MKCPHCGAIFCPDRGPDVNVYCDERCKRRAHAAAAKRSRKSCRNKLRDATEAEAAKRLSAINTHAKDGELLQSAYHCELCDGWHLTRRYEPLSARSELAPAFAALLGG